VETALVTLSEAGARLLGPLAGKIPDATLFVHDSVRAAASGNGPAAGNPWSDLSGAEAAESEANNTRPSGPIVTVERFSKIAELTSKLFPVCRNLVYAAPCGVVVRAIAPLVQSKYKDPAVVVLDVGGRWAISLLSGHEGGANDLAIRIGNLTGAEPIVTTTTEAVKSVIVGIGCRRGTSAEILVSAIRETLADEGVALEEVRCIASADIKSDEAGLIEAGGILGAPLRFIPSKEIMKSKRDFAHSDFVLGKVNLPAVAEPAALLAGRRTSFICRKKIVKGITIALAREEFSWSESAPEGH
jgi:cobalt-precorrin 5A hydrolase